MKKRLASIGIVCLLVISGFVGLINFGDNEVQGATLVSGIITTDTTWYLAGSPYIVVGNITVESGVTLTIEPGVEVKFDGYYRLDVKGTLIAIGTETNRIIITSNMAKPIPGDWEWIGIRYKGHGEIKYCDISYSNFGIGASSSNNITNNNVFLNYWGGIFLIDSSYNNITGNNISLSNGTGIFLNVSSNYNIITNNNIFSNNMNGIDITMSSNNNIINNDVSSNGYYGIRLGLDASNNRVYHNNIIDNFIQASDTTNMGNQWDDGYPSGGNYWSDFDQSSEGAYDDYQGPDQDVLGSDGIVDLGPPAGGKNPYLIDADSQDNYPLMAPFGVSQPSPTPPPNFIARLSPGSPIDIELIWNASSDDGSGDDDIEGYTVYKSVTGFDGTYEFEAWIKANGSSYYSWIDFGAGDENWNDYFYIVRANDTSNNEEQNTNKVGKFVNYLVEGWNLISIPLIQRDTSRESALQTIEGNYSAVMGYHAGKSRPWLNWHRDKPNEFNDVIEINHEEGYYIDMILPDHLVTVGKVAPLIEIDLKPGWNLVGYPSFTEQLRNEALSSISGSYNKAYFYNPTSDRDEAVGSDDLMNPGYGYWVHATKRCTLEVLS